MDTKRPWLRWYNPGVPQSLVYPNITLFEMLKNTASRFPDNPAIYFMGQTLSYRKLLILVNKYSRKLKRAGVRRGDRVAVILPNCPKFVIAAYASSSIGAIFVPINPRLTRTECLRIIKNANPKIVITSDFGSRLFGFALFSKLLLSGHIFEAVKQNLRRRFNETPEEISADTAVLVYTSGTTGKPNGVMLTDRNIMANVIQSKAWLPFIREGEEVMLSVIPFFHSYGMTIGMHFAVMIGACNILVPKFSARETLELMIKAGLATLFPVIPAILSALLNHKELLKKASRSLKILTCGASSLDPKIQEEFEGVSGVKILQGFGLSEASPVTHLNPLGKNKRGSIGIPYPDTDARLVDIESGQEVPLGEIGELIVRGPQVMKGYWNNPAETSRTLQSGWLHTADLMRMDADGFFYFVDRKDDLIKVGGEKVFPCEVEECILKYPGVAEAAAIGVPDKFRGSVVKVFIVPKSGMVLDQQKITDFCSKNLASFKVPRHIEFIEELPKNLLRKVIRKKLRKA